jgi:hypothetical protein
MSSFAIAAPAFNIAATTQHIPKGPTVQRAGSNDTIIASSASTTDERFAQDG